MGRWWGAVVLRTPPSLRLSECRYGVRGDRWCLEILGRANGMVSMIDSMATSHLCMTCDSIRFDPFTRSALLLATSNFGKARPMAPGEKSSTRPRFISLRSRRPAFSSRAAPPIETEAMAGRAMAGGAMAGGTLMVYFRQPSMTIHTIANMVTTATRAITPATRATGTMRTANIPDSLLIQSRAATMTTMTTTTTTTTEVTTVTANFSRGSNSSSHIRSIRGILEGLQVHSITWGEMASSTRQEPTTMTPTYPTDLPVPP